MSNNIVTEISNNQLFQQVDDINIEQQLIINEIISDINTETQNTELDIYPPYINRQNAFCTNIQNLNQISI
tara:strand:+ start:3310 stop:3522 length:213 start_codon:yes stop_codon:yes gene_type:complete